MPGQQHITMDTAPELFVTEMQALKKIELPQPPNESLEWTVESGGPTQGQNTKRSRSHGR